MGRLDGKIAVVIGGGEGIGGAVATRFAAEGAKVNATSRRADESAPGTLRTERVDATDVEAAGQLLARIGREEGRIDILCVSAGHSDYAGLSETTEEHFDRTFALNVRSLVFATRNAVAVMPEGGAVVLIGSIAASIGTNLHFSPANHVMAAEGCFVACATDRA